MKVLLFYFYFMVLTKCIDLSLIRNIEYLLKSQILNRYIMFGRGICEKYQSRDKKFPELRGEENLVSRLVFVCRFHEYSVFIVCFRNVLICYKLLRNFDFCYMFTSEHFRVSNLINHVTLRIKVKNKYFE